MHTKQYLVTTLLASSLLMGVAVGSAHAQEKALQPESSWALTKVDRVAQGGNSYCTLSRKYSDNVVLSLARNQTEEYSLAIDFQKPTFDTDKSVKVNLQPGPGQIRAYDLMPTSDKAIVVRLGWDTGFFDTLNQSQNLKATVKDQEYSFSLSEIAKGQADLQDCMNSIISAAKSPETDGKQGATTDVLSAQPTATSDDFGAQKVEDAKATKPVAMAAVTPAPAPLVVNMEDEPAPEKAEDVAVKSNFNKSKFEPEPAQKVVTKPAPKTQAPPVIVSAPPATTTALAPEPVVAPKTVSVTTTASSSDAKDVAVLRKQVAELTQQNATLQEAASNQVVLQKEIAALKQQVDAQQKSSGDANAAKLKDLEAQVAQLSAQNKTLQQSGSDIATLQQQNKTLEAKVKALQDEAAGKSSATSMTPAFVPPAEKAKLETLKKDVEGLKAQNKTLQEQLAAANAKVQATPAAPAVDTKALADAQAKIKELEIKNSQLQDTVRQSQTRIAETAINTEGPALKKIAELETKLEAAKADNAKLAQQLDGIRLQQEDKRLASVAGDWDLEKATKRFNEAEREIRRLGLKLEQERTSCNREKAQIENMLFDPAVTEQKQLERLSSLEAQLREAQDKLAGRISQTSMSAEPPAGMSSDAQSVITKLQAENEALKDNNLVLRQETDRLRIQMTDIQSNGTVRADNVASARLETDDLRRQLAMKNSQTEALQNQVNYLQKENTQIKNRMSITAEPAAAVYAPPSVPRAPAPMARAPEPQSDRITSNISRQRERLAQSGNPSAATLAQMQPAAGKSDDPLLSRISTAPRPSGYDAGSIKSLLQQAGVSVDNVKKSAVGLHGADNFSWTDTANRNVRGIASVKALSSGAEFDGTVSEYIANQKAMCPGDFASIPSNAITSASKQMALYEIACVSGSTSSSASLLFFEDQGRFIAVSNQTSTQDMDVAMDSRDRVANFVRGL